MRPVADAKAKAGPFNAGFLWPLDPTGDKYGVKKGAALLAGGTFTLAAGSATYPGTWPATNAAKIDKPSSFSFAAGTGVFKGKIVTTLNNKKVSTAYEGVALRFPLVITTTGGNQTVQGGGFISDANGTKPVTLSAP
jgi:hypothetical protein